VENDDILKWETSNCSAYPQNCLVVLFYKNSYPKKRDDQRRRVGSEEAIELIFNSFEIGKPVPPPHPPKWEPVAQEKIVCTGNKSWICELTTGCSVTPKGK